MKSNSRFYFNIIFLLFSVSLAYTDATAADFIDNKVIQNNKIEATTLSFENIDTANNSKILDVFNINGFIPNGFQVKTVRLNNEGKTNFVYRIKTEDFTGDEQFCKSLDVELIHNKELKYEGKLEELSIDISSPIDQNQIDWIIYLKFNPIQDNLINKSCDFNFTFKAWVKFQGENSGFVYQKKLSNHITSGKW